MSNYCTHHCCKYYLIPSHQSTKLTIILATSILTLNSMSETEIIASQIFILAVAVIIGVIAAKTGIITKESNGLLSKLIFNISLPLMLFTNFFKLDVTPKLLSNSLAVLAISTMVILFLLLIGWVVTKILKMDVREAAV